MVMLDSMSSRVAAVALLVLGLIAPSASVRAADVEAGRRKSEPCATCHGRDGNATIPGTPSLAGHPAYYTHWQLVMFRNERRRDQRMTPQMAARLSDEDMADLAAYYAAQASRPRPGRAAVDLATREAGERLTNTHHCTSCHGPGLMGQQAVPRLVGQDQQYLLKRLRGFKTQTTSDLEGFMTTSAQPLADEEIEVLARYISSLEPEAKEMALPRGR
jgi:cytochrome c553